MAKKVLKDKLVKDAHHLCEFLLIVMIAIRDNEHEFSDQEIGSTLSLYYTALKPFEDFLIQSRLIENDDYGEIFNYAENMFLRYETHCPCSQCSN